MAQNTQIVLQRLQAWIRDAAEDRGLLIPVSGGTDSALCYWLCKQVLPGKVRAVHFGDKLRSRAWFESLGPVESIPAPEEQDHQELSRWAMLLSLSTRARQWLVGSRNRSEDVFGTFSLASRVATFYPLIGVWKTDVMELCQAVGIPSEIIASSHRADVPCDRTDELAQIGIDRIDRFLKAKEGVLAEESLAGWPKDHREYLERKYRQGQFKRKLPLRGPSC